MGKNIDEVIADAIAEEEVTMNKEPARAFSGHNTKVSVDLDEYIALKMKERDFNIILGVIGNGFRLAYRNDDIYFENDNELTNAFKVLYPEVAEAILKTLQSKEEGTE